MKYPVFSLLSFLFFTLTGTAQTPFRHVTSAANTNAHITTLDHPQLNGNPSAILFIMPNWNTGGGSNAAGVNYQQNASVHYDNGYWTIFNQNTTVAMPINLTFNVLIAPADDPNYFTTICTAESKAGLPSNNMILNHPATNGKANALLLVTQNRLTIYNNNSQVVVYANDKWYIANNNYFSPDPATALASEMPVGAQFNVMVIENGVVPGFSSAKAFLHTTTAENTIPSGNAITFFDQPFLNSNTDALIWATPNWGWGDGFKPNPTVNTSGPYNDSPIMSWYDHPNDVWNYKNGYWSIYNSNGTLLKPGTKFNVLVLPLTEDLPLWEIVSAGGDFAQDPDFGNLHWTVGEPVVETFNRRRFRLTQGFHQVYYRVLPQDAQGFPTARLQNKKPTVQVRLYPNPTAQRLIVETTYKNDFNIMVRDLNGKLLLQQTGTSDKTELNLQTLPDGMYLVTITDKDKQLQTFKIQKLHF